MRWGYVLGTALKELYYEWRCLSRSHGHPGNLGFLLACKHCEIQTSCTLKQGVGVEWHGAHVRSPLCVLLQRPRQSQTRLRYQMCSLGTLSLSPFRCRQSGAAAGGCCTALPGSEMTRAGMEAQDWCAELPLSSGCTWQCRTHSNYCAITSFKMHDPSQVVPQR